MSWEAVLIKFLAGIAIASVCVCGAHASADTVVPNDGVTTRVIARANATSSSAQVGSLLAGQSAELLGEVPNWYRVRLRNGVTGFVSKRWTRTVPEGRPDPGISAMPYPYTIDVADVGTGLGVLVRGPNFTLVYDGGSNDDFARGADNRFLAFVKLIAPKLPEIDHLILSHPHRDHVELLPDLFGAYRVRQVWDSGRVHPICGYRAFLKAVSTSGAQYHTVTRDGGTSAIKFAASTCYGQALPEETVTLSHSTRIQTGVPIPLGENASMTILHADGDTHSSPNENTVVVRLDLGQARVLLMGDAEAGGRKAPTVAPTAASIEGILLTCCVDQLSADVLIAGHHGSMTSSRKAFLNSVSASTYVISSGPTKYANRTLPDPEIETELRARGQLFTTYINDTACRTNPKKIGTDSDNEPGGCDNVRIAIPTNGSPQVSYWRGAE